METMKDYHYLHLKCDVLLLANAFEIFRNNSLNYYSSHYFSAPDFSQEAMLKMKKKKIELIPDPSLYIFFQKGTICGLSYIYDRYSKANNK